MDCTTEPTESQGFDEADLSNIADSFTLEEPSEADAAADPVDDTNGHAPMGILPHHWAKLQSSGLSAETVREAGIESVSDYRRLASFLNRKTYPAKWGPAIVFTYRNRHGDVVLRRVRPDNPPMRGGSPAKYMQPAGVPIHAYVPPGVFEILDNPAIELTITEGELKACCATQNGFPCVGLSGVSCWHVAKTNELVPGLADAKLSGRPVRIVFDSDAATNENVKLQECQIAAALTQRGAVVRVVRIPPTDQGEKQGVDDFIVAHGKVAFRKLLDSAEEPEAVDPGELREPPSEIYFDTEAARMVDALKHDGLPTLRYWKGSFWHWREGAYREISDDEIRARVALRLNDRFFRVGGSHISNTIEHIKAQTILSDRIDPPAWLDKKARGWQPSDLLVCKNRIVHLPSLIDGGDCFVDPTPSLFTTSALAFDFIDVVDCPKAERWLSFLAELWPDDPEAVEALQLWFGYLLTHSTRLQKLLAMIGPTRSGKGTIVRILTALVGRENCASPTLSSFSTNFGLSPLVGKSLATVADARFSGRADAAVICERLLSITGEDLLTIDRKHRDPISVTLPTRIMLVSNELPRLSDSSGALSNRMIVLQLTRSWLGREDHGLTDQLLEELPGILWWSIEGWSKLRQRGRLLQPASGAELLDEAHDLLSPISVFVRERCEVGPQCEVRRRELYEAYAEWAKDNGRVHVQDEATFGRDLRAAVPGLRTARPREGGSRVRTYVGVRLVLGDCFADDMD